MNRALLAAPVLAVGAVLSLAAPASAHSPAVVFDPQGDVDILGYYGESLAGTGATVDIHAASIHRGATTTTVTVGFYRYGQEQGHPTSFAFDTNDNGHPNYWLRADKGGEVSFYKGISRAKRCRTGIKVHVNEPTGTTTASIPTKCLGGASGISVQAFASSSLKAGHTALDGTSWSPRSF